MFIPCETKKPTAHVPDAATLQQVTEFFERSINSPDGNVSFFPFEGQHTLKAWLDISDQFLLEQQPGLMDLPQT